MQIDQNSLLEVYAFIGIIASIGIACTYWSQYKHRKRHQHHRS